jgi:hypothetical protein
MRIIIAGGSGLIGSALAQDLAKDKHEVIILSRNPARLSPVTSEVKFITWDGKTQQGWGKVVEGVNAIINLAGANIAGEGFLPARWTRARKENIRLSRLNAGKAITEAISSAREKPGVLVQASGIGYYGPRGDEVIDESATPGRDFMAQLSQEWEQSTAQVEGQGVRRVIIRTGVVLSKEGGALSRLLLPYKLFMGGPLGNGRQVLSWIHIDDEVKAIRFLIDTQDSHGAYNLTAPHPVTNAELGKQIAKFLRRPYFLPVPGFAMRWAFGEVSTVVLDGQRVHPNRLLNSGFEFRYPTSDKALAEIIR